MTHTPHTHACTPYTQSNGRFVGIICSPPTAGFCCHVGQSCLVFPQHWSGPVCVHHAEGVQRRAIPVSTWTDEPPAHKALCEVSLRCIQALLCLLVSRHLAVPLPVGECVFSLTWLLPTYFLFAVTYDILQTLADVTHYLPYYGPEPELHVYNVTGSVTAANLSSFLWALRRQHATKLQRSKCFLLLLFLTNF